MTKLLLELFSGTGAISTHWRKKGGAAFRVDWAKNVDAELHEDVSKLTIERIVELCGRIPDVVWASPQCTTYSVATHRHRTIKEGLQPKTDLARRDDETNIAMWRLIDDLIENGTRYYFVENPMGRMRHMGFVKGRPRYSITYCSYGGKGNYTGYSDFYIKKPTDIWTNHPLPSFLPCCTGSTQDHPHGRFDVILKRDYLSRGMMPSMLIDHIVNIAMMDQFKEQVNDTN